MNGLLIFLGILKWIGIVLLALLLLILLLVLTVMLSPIRYRLAGEKKAELGGSFGVSWLFGAVKADGTYTQAESLKLKVKVLWFTIIGGGPKEKKEKKPKKEKKKKAAKVEERKPDIAAAEKIEQPKQEAPKAEAAEEKKPEPPKPKPTPQKMEQKQPKTVRRVKLSEIEEKPPAELPSEEDEDFFTGEESAEKKKEKIPPIVKELWSIEDKKGIFKALQKLLKRLVKGILPGNLFLKGTIGTGDPTTTGYVLAAAGILTAKFGSDIQIKGDFTKATAEDMEVRVKGEIVLGRLVWAALAFVLAKPVRKAIWKMIRFVKKQKKAEEGKGE